jgi:hypothetical protein
MICRRACCAPSVFNWFRGLYQGGSLAEAGLFAPEFQRPRNQVIKAINYITRFRIRAGRVSVRRTDHQHH